MARSRSERFKYGAGDGNELVRWFRGKVEGNDEVAQKAMAMAAERGEELVKYNISTRGTNEPPWDTSWDRMAHATPGRYESAPGRVASGKMISAVGSWVSSGVDGKTRIGFGWTNPSERETYFEAQEGGFTHNFTGKKIRGMYAVADAADEVLGQLKRDIKAGMKGV